SDRAFIGRVIATMRPWREYEASLARLYVMEDEKRKHPPLPRLPAHLEWWVENFSLIRDIATRRYPVHAQSYTSLLEDPARVVRETLRWIGDGDVDAAIAAVKPEHRTQSRVESTSFEPEMAALCDELYDRIDRRQPLDTNFIQALNDADARISEELSEAYQAVL